MFFAKIGKTDEEKFLAFIEIREKHKNIIEVLVKYCGTIFSVCAIFMSGSLAGIFMAIPIYLMCFFIGLTCGYVVAWYFYMIERVDIDTSVSEETKTSNEELIRGYFLYGETYVASKVGAELGANAGELLPLIICIYTAPLNAIFRLPEYIIIPKKMKEKYGNNQ